VFGPYKPWKYLVYGGLYFEGHSFVSGGYVLAKEGIGKVCSVPEGMRKVFSFLNRKVHGGSGKSL